MKDELKARYAEASKLVDIGQFNSAKSIYLELSQLDPKSTAVFASLGRVCWEMQLLDEAVTAFQKAIELSPTLEAVSLGLFHCLWQLGRHEEAFEEMERFMSVSDSADYRAIVREINESD